MFTTTYMGPYQPLAWLSYSIDYRCWGLSPIAFHASNLVLHSITAALFFFLARELIRAAIHASGLVLDFSSAAAALFFSVHPLRVESVAWITERRDVLCGVFFVGALLVYVRGAAGVATGTRRCVLGPGCIVLVILAALSKGWAMTLPFLMFVLDFYPLRRHPQVPLRRLISEKTSILVIAGLTAAIAYWGQQSGAWGPQQFAHRTVFERVAQAAYALVFYPTKTIWPASLLPIYELPVVIRLTDARYAAAAAAVVLISIAAWLARRRCPAVLATWLAYVVTIAPFVGITQAGNQIVADRYSYLSCLSFPLLVAGGMAIAARRPNRFIRTALFATSFVVTAMLATEAWRLTLAWHDSLSLWKRAVALNPNSWVSHGNLADALRQFGDTAGAKRHFQKAVALNPRSGIAWLNLGEILKAENQFPEAEAALRQAAAHHPEPALAELQLGEICARTNRPDESLIHFAEAARNPRTAAWAEFGAGIVLRNQNRPDESLAHLRRAAQLDPSIPGVAQEIHAAEVLATSPVYPAATAPYKQN